MRQRQSEDVEASMTHDTTLDASALAIRESLRLWVRAQIAQGHPAGLVHSIIEQEAAMIRLQREGQEWEQAVDGQAEAK